MAGISQGTELWDKHNQTPVSPKPMLSLNWLKKKVTQLPKKEFGNVPLNCLELADKVRLE